MADAQSNLYINIDTTQALANIRALQAEISAFQTAMAKGNAKQQSVAQGLQRQLINTVNATGQFSARMTTIASTTETFTNALEKNKLSMREYFRYGMASTKTFGRMFTSEFETISKVTRERVKSLQTQYVKLGRDANGALKAIAVRPLALDMENLATKTALAAQRQQIFNQLLKQGSTNLLNFGKNTQWAGRQLMVGFTIPLSIMGAAAIREFRKIEEQAIKFKRVYGDMFSTTADTEKALKNVRDLADEFTKYGIAVEQTIGLAATVAQMGSTGQDLIGQVTEATRLAVLGGIQQEEALNTTISLTSAFGTATEELAKKINFLNSVENQTILSIEDFNEAIPKAGPVVQQLGGDIEDLAFFLTAMREGGINASESANALKSGLASIINPTEKAAEFLGKLGINIKAIVDANKGDIKGIVVGLAQALDTLDPLNRARAIEQLFGKFQFARISTLFQNVIKEGSQAQQVLRLTQATTAELAVLAERELKRVEESPAFRLQKQIENLKAALAPVGEEFAKLVTPLLEFAVKILESFNNLDSGVKRFVTGTIAVIGGIAPVALMAFGLLANGVANIIKLFGIIRGVYQKAGSQSQILGQQTQYMTQEQLEAAAVAASLNQSHNTLIQTFTSEIAALNNLAAAYSRVAAAQAKSAAGFGPGIQTNLGKKPKKMKTGGIIQVPGTGSGDKIPALLEPGEAVIPKKMTSKYAGFIQGMINDQIPGFRFGFNPFANMLGRSNVAARMQSKDFLSSLRSGNTKYQSAFATGTGADYLTSMGLPNTAQAKLRAKMESSMLGLGPSTPVASRPTYGYAKTSLLQKIMNSILFGQKGRRFNAATSSSDALARYGDIDLITKGSVAGRSTAFAGDMLLAYSRNQNLSKFRGVAPMRGANADQIAAAGFGAFNRPGGSIFKTGTGSMAVNPQIPYIETQTPGGFAFNEISKIIAKDPVLKAQLQSELKSAGLGGIRVTSPNFISKLFKAMGVPGFQDGVILPDNAASVASTTGVIAAHGSNFKRISDQEAKDFAKQNLTPGSRAYENFMKGTGKGRNLYSNLVFGMPGLFNTGNMTGKDAARWIRKNREAFYGYLTNMYGLDPNAPASRTFSNSVAKTLSAYGDAKIDDPKFFDSISRSAKGVANKEFKEIFNKAASSFATGEIFGSSGKSRREALAGAGPSYTRRRATIRSLFNLPAKQFEAELMGTKLSDSGVVKSTTGAKKPASAKRVGGKPSDTRVTAVTPGETILNKQSTRAIRRGLFSFIPGLGLLGRADGLPEGQVAGSRLPGMMGRAGGVAGVASLAAMGFGMTGLPGSNIAGQAAMPLMMASMALPLLSNPIGIAVAALGGLATAAFMVSQQFSDTRDKAADLALSMGNGTKTLLPLAEFMGRATATEMLTKQRQTQFAPISAQSAEFGAMFAQSEPGAAMLSALQKTISGAGGRAGASAGLFGQLSTAITSGVLTSQEAVSIAQEMGRQLGDARIGINVTAQIVDTFGPNGQNLKNNPLEIRMKLLSETGKPMQQFLQQIVDKAAAATATTAGMTAGQEEFIGGRFGTTENQISLSAGQIGTFVGQSISMMQTQRELLASSELYYDNLINSARARYEESQSAEDLKKLNDLIADRDNARAKLSEQAATNTKAMIDAYKKVPASQASILDGLKKQAEIFYQDSPFLATAQETMDKIKNLGLDGNEIVFAATLASGDIPADAMSYFLENSEKGVQVDVAAIISAQGAQTGVETIQLMNMFAENDVIQKQIVVQIQAGNVDILNKLSMLPNKKVLEFFVARPKALERLEKTYERIDRLAQEGDLTAQTVIEEKIILDSTALAKFKSNQEYFNSLPEMQRKLYLETFIASYASMPEEEVDNFIKTKIAEAGAGGGFVGQMYAGAEGRRRAAADLAARDAKAITDAFNAITGADDTTTTDTTLGGTGTGKDPYTSIVDGLKKVQRETRQQNIAAKKLIDAGLDAASAYELIADKAFAAAVASKKISTKELAEIVRLQKEVTDELEQQNALANIRLAIEEFNKSKILEDSLAKTGLTKLEIAAILTDEDLMTRASGIIRKSKNLGALSGESFGKEFSTRVDQILSGPEFFQSKWQEAYNAIEQTFEAQENALTIQFQIDTKKDRDLIQNAERRIQVLQDKIDDYGFNLQEIAIEEDKINDKYQKRAEALNRVSFISERIARQQASQLSIAEAISRGDIAAAAAAIQEARAQEAQDALDEQQRAMDMAREQELAVIKAANGMTRKQIEDAILETEKQIFDIRVKELEPAQRRVELAQNDLDLAIQKLTVEGKSRLEWLNVNSQIVLAQQKTRDWIELLKQAAFWAEKAMQNPSGGRNNVGGPAGDPARGRELERLIGITRARVQSGQFTDEAQKQRLIQMNIDRIEELRRLTGVANAGASGVSLYAADGGMVPKYLRMGGLLPYKAEGGSIFKPLGTDTIPAMLSPGEFVVRKYAVDNFGVDKLKAINSGTYSGDSVYNYGITLNVSSASNADEIAHKVITQIKRIDSQRLRSSTF